MGIGREVFVGRNCFSYPFIGRYQFLHGCLIKFLSRFSETALCVLDVHIFIECLIEISIIAAKNIFKPEYKNNLSQAKRNNNIIWQQNFNKWFFIDSFFIFLWILCAKSLILLPLLLLFLLSCVFWIFNQLFQFFKL